MRVPPKSVTEPLEIDTCVAKPCNLPSTCGITRLLARVAPVDIGIAFAATARARRRQLWGPPTVDSYPYGHLS